MTLFQVRDRLTSYLHTDVNIGKILHTTPDWQIQLNDNDYAHFYMALFQNTKCTPEQIVKN